VIVSGSRWPIASARRAFAVIALVLVVLGGSSVLAIDAESAQKVRLAASVSGSELTVDLRARPGSRCPVRLGSGERAVKLPEARISGEGRGTITASVPSTTSEGLEPITARCTRGESSITGKTFVSIPARLSGGNGGAMAIVLNALLYLLLAGSLLLFIGALIQMTVRERVEQEKFLQSLSLLGGAVVALGAESAGVSFADFTVDALTGARPGGEAFKAISVIFPGGIGALVGFYFVRVSNKNVDKGKRFMCFLGMLTVIAFLVILAEATSVQGLFLGAAAIPNASFVTGLIGGLAIFTDSAQSPQGSRRSRLAALGALVRRRGPTNAAAGTKAAPARNPFDDV